MRLNGARAICQSLVEEGVSTIFGLPGGAIMPLYDVLPRAFTGDSGVLHEAHELWPFLCLLQPIGGVPRLSPLVAIVVIVSIVTMSAPISGPSSDGCFAAKPGSRR